jgi:S2P endopeptidase
MTLAALSVLATLLWLLLHVYKRYAASSARAHPHLPFASAKALRLSRFLGRWRVHSSFLRVRCQTASLNAAHDSLAEHLSARPRTRAFLAFAFDAGTVLAIVGQAAAVLLLAWTAFILAQSSLGWRPADARTNLAHPLLKRSADLAPNAGAPPTDHNSQSMLVQPLVSTVP